MPRILKLRNFKKKVVFPNEQNKNTRNDIEMRNNE